MKFISETDPSSSSTRKWCRAKKSGVKDTVPSAAPFLRNLHRSDMHKPLVRIVQREQGLKSLQTDRLYVKARENYSARRVWVRKRVRGRGRCSAPHVPPRRSHVDVQIRNVKNIPLNGSMIYPIGNYTPSYSPNGALSFSPPTTPHSQRYVIHPVDSTSIRCRLRVFHRYLTYSDELGGDRAKNGSLFLPLRANRLHVWPATTATGRPQSTVWRPPGTPDA